VLVLAGIAVAVYAAYDVTGSSAPENFTAGTATNLQPDPEEGDLSNILPGQTVGVDVSVYNANPVAVELTGVDLVISYATECDLTTTPWSGSYALGAASTVGVVVGVTMGAPQDSCEGAVLTVSATASGTMP
jgi:hypothetical protein